VPGFFPVVRIGTPDPLIRKRGGGGAHSPAGEGGGPNFDEGTETVVF
jgi:hypothetical protein